MGAQGSEGAEGGRLVCWRLAGSCGSRDAPINVHGHWSSRDQECTAPRAAHVIEGACSD